MADHELSERNDLSPYPINATIRYTDEDIAFAKRQDSYKCVLVRAIQRQFPQAIRVRVNLKTIGWSLPDEDIRLIYPTPPAAKTKVIMPFDSGEVVKPGTLQLRGGQYRAIDHNYGPRERQNERNSRANIPPSERLNHPHWAKANFERYVVTSESA